MLAIVDFVSLGIDGIGILLNASAVTSWIAVIRTILMVKLATTFVVDFWMSYVKGAELTLWVFSKNFFLFCDELNIGEVDYS